MNEQELTKKLTAPFEAKDVEWRIQQTTQDKSRGLAVAFITSRAIQKRLDETVGPFHWKTEFSPWHQIVNKGSQLCALSIYDEERKEWVTKTDGAENSDIEPQNAGRPVCPDASGKGGNSIIPGPAENGFTGHTAGSRPRHPAANQGRRLHLRLYRPGQKGIGGRKAHRHQPL